MGQSKKITLNFCAFITTHVALGNTQITTPTLSDAKLKNFYKNMPVLVTGGCGFIGSHLAEKLVKLGADVTILDDLSAGKLENIAAIKDDVTLIQKSVTDIDACRAASENKKIIFHLAAFISVPGSVEKPYMCHDINIQGTQNMLEAARINNVQRFVFSSSSAVYGECDHMCNETQKPSPTSPYGFSKLMGELYCQEYAYVYNLETVMMRYFNVYGSRQNPNGPYAGVVAKFMYNMARNLPITIFGDGMQTRDFVPVEYVVNANIIFGMAPKDMIQTEVFNIATGKSINLFELIEILKKNYPGYIGEVQFGPARLGDVKHSSADCSKYFELLRLLQ